LLETFSSFFATFDNMAREIDSLTLSAVCAGKPFAATVLSPYMRH